MSLQELQDAIADQATVPTKRFNRPRDVLEYVTGPSPPPKRERVVVDMTVLRVEELDQCWHVFMVDKNSEDDFDKRRELIEKLNGNIKPKFVFCLTLWKARKQSREHATGDDFIPGHTYVVSNVSSLQLYEYSGLSQGSVQARFVVKAETTDEESPSEEMDEPVLKKSQGRCQQRDNHDPSKVVEEPAPDRQDPRMKVTEHPRSKSNRQAKDTKT
jgi:hypothetical protein